MENSRLFICSPFGVIYDFLFLFFDQSCFILYSGKLVNKKMQSGKVNEKMSAAMARAPFTNFFEFQKNIRPNLGAKK